MPAEAIPRPTKTLEDDSASDFGPSTDEELDHEQRAAKKRRIETIAERYTYGLPIFIHTARLRGPFGGNGSGNWVNPWNESIGREGKGKSKGQERLIAVGEASTSRSHILATTKRAGTYGDNSHVASEVWLRTRGTRRTRHADGRTPEPSDEPETSTIATHEQSPSRCKPPRPLRLVDRGRDHEPMEQGNRGIPSHAPENPRNRPRPKERTNMRKPRSTEDPATTTESCYKRKDVRLGDAERKATSLDTCSEHGLCLPTTNFARSPASNQQSGPISALEPTYAGFTPINKPPISPQRFSLGNVFPVQFEKQTEVREDDAPTLPLYSMSTGRDSEPVLGDKERPLNGKENRDPRASKEPTQPSREHQDAASGSFTYRRASDPPRASQPAPEAARMFKSSATLNRKARRRVSFKSTPAGTRSRKPVSTEDTKEEVTTAKPAENAEVEGEGAGTHQVPQCDSSAPSNASNSNPGSDCLLRKALRKSGFRGSTPNTVVFEEAPDQTSHTAVGLETSPRSVASDDFLTQAAVLEAQRAFQEGITPFTRRCQPGIQQTGDVAKPTSSFSTSPVPQLSPMVPFSCVYTPEPNEPPVSTQELFDTAKGMVFSTVKRPVRRPSKNNPSTRAAGPAAQEADLLQESPSRNTEVQINDLCPQSTRRIPQCLQQQPTEQERPYFKGPGAASATSLTASRLLAETSSTASSSVFVNGTTNTTNHASIPVYVPISTNSQNAQKASESTLDLDLGLGVDTDSVIFADVDECSRLVATWDPIEEARQMLREQKQVPRIRSGQDTVQYLATKDPDLPKSSMKNSRRRSSGKVAIADITDGLSDVG